jgi:hypothetical protein
MEAGQAASKMPQAVADTLSEVGATVSRVPEAVGESLSGQVPQSVPGLVDAQADHFRETAEATASAARARVGH